MTGVDPTLGRDLAVMALIAALGVLVYSFAAVRNDRRRIDRLETRVACLEHPHGESSIAGRRIGGRFVVTSGPTRTGCAR